MTLVPGVELALFGSVLLEDSSVLDLHRTGDETDFTAFLHQAPYPPVIVEFLHMEKFMPCICNLLHSPSLNLHHHHHIHQHHRLKYRLTL